MLKRIILTAMLASMAGCVVVVAPHEGVVRDEPQSAARHYDDDRDRYEDHDRYEERDRDEDDHKRFSDERKHFSRDILLTLNPAYARHVDGHYFKRLLREYGAKKVRMKRLRTASGHRQVWRVEGLEGESQIRRLMVRLSREPEIIKVEYFKGAASLRTPPPARPHHRDDDRRPPVTPPVAQRPVTPPRTRPAPGPTGGALAGATAGAVAAPPTTRPAPGPTGGALAGATAGAVAGATSGAKKPAQKRSVGVIVGLVPRFGNNWPPKLLPALNSKCLHRGESLRYQRTLTNSSHLLVAQIIGGEKREKALYSCLKKQPQVRFAEENERRRVR